MNIAKQIAQLLQKTQQPLGCSRIAKNLKMKKQKAHYHLSKMKSLGLVYQNDRGKYILLEIFYSSFGKTFKQNFDALLDNIREAIQEDQESNLRTNKAKNILKLLLDLYLSE